jgi:cysteine synthase A
VREPAEYVIFDPHREYGVPCIERLYRSHRSRAVCCFTRPLEGPRHARELLRSHGEAIAAVYYADMRDPAALAAHLRARHSIGAVVPFDDEAMLHTTQLLEPLGLAWPPGGVLRRARDKHALKAALRAAAPALRVNASERVCSTGEVLAASHAPEYRRFVLKPNDGSGNRDVAVFGADSPRDSIEGYFEKTAGRPIVMEEYIGGREYFLNGQVDEQGAVTVVAIFEYARQPANGRHNLDFETLKLRHAHPRFAPLAAYAASVLQALRVERTPFHLALKVDALGPCLIEVAARFAGHGNVHLCNELHGSRVDLIDWACHHYLSDAPYHDAELDWRRYDAQALRYVHGLAERDERIYELFGTGDVEALPEFYRWVKRPALGARVERTLSSLTMPWMLIMRGATEDRVAAAADEARRLIRWNLGATPVAQRWLRVARHRAPGALARLRESAPALLLEDGPAWVRGETRRLARAAYERAGRTRWARAASAQMQAETRIATGTILTASPSEEAMESLPISHGEGTSPST